MAVDKSATEQEVALLGERRRAAEARRVASQDQIEAAGAELVMLERKLAELGGVS
jgi:hypothetical protein